MHDKPEGPRDRAGDERRIFQHAQIEKANLAVEFRQQVMGQRDRNGRLTDSARTPERDEAFAQQSVRQFPQNVLPPDHPLQAMRQ